MIGRGTRLCPDLFAPDEHKTDFRVFDFCGNFTFFSENPDGISTSNTRSLTTRLFENRVNLVADLQKLATKKEENNKNAINALKNSLINLLYDEVSAMNTDNFIVRMQLEAVETFKNRASWDNLDDSKKQILITQVAELPSEIQRDDLQSRLFDLIALKLQLATLNADNSTMAALIKQVQNIAMQLEEKNNLAPIKAQLAYLQAIQSGQYWQNITLDELEKMRLILRELVVFIDRKKRKIVYTDFDDDVVTISDTQVVDMPKMTGLQYEKKVKDYLKNHLNQISIARLRANKPLTDMDVRNLQDILESIGDKDGKILLTNLLNKHQAPSLAYFVRSIVGLDRIAAQTPFMQFIQDESLTANQIRFIELIIEQLTTRGVISAESLYEPPFTDLHSGGAEAIFIGKEAVIDDVFDTVKQLNEVLTKIG